MKYISLRVPPKAWTSDHHALEERPSCTVWEVDKTPEPTGLLDSEGVPLYRQPETFKMGFVGKKSE